MPAPSRGGTLNPMSRVLTEVLAHRFDEDLALILDMLALIPPDKHDWRPDWPSTPFTFAELTDHLVMSWGGVIACLHKLHPEKLSHLATQREIPLEIARSLTQEGFALTADSDLARRIPTHFNPAGEPFLATLLINGKHIHHHAYQLFVYLKLLGLPVGARQLYRFQQ